MAPAGWDQIYNCCDTDDCNGEVIEETGQYDYIMHHNHEKTDSYYVKLKT